MDRRSAYLSLILPYFARKSAIKMKKTNFHLVDKSSFFFGAEDERLLQGNKVSSLKNLRCLRFAACYTLLAWTRENTRVILLALNTKKGCPNRTSFFGAEDEIWTRATVSDATPLAGEPLEPLGYFCMAFHKTLYYYTTFFPACQSFLKEKTKKLFFFLLQKTKAYDIIRKNKRSKFF